MDQLILLDELDKVAIFDELSRNLAERILVQMFSEVKEKVESPQLVHYASFISSYIKKQCTQVALVVAGLVLEKCSAGLNNQILNQLGALISNSLKDQDLDALLNLIFKIVERNIKANSLQIHGGLISALMKLQCIALPAAQQPLADILNLIVQTEYQYKLTQNSDVQMQYSTLICSEIVHNLRQTEANQLNTLRNITKFAENLVPLLFKTASSTYLNQQSPAFQLFYELCRFQVIHANGQYLEVLFQKFMENVELLEFPCIWGFYRAVQSNPLPTQVKIYTKLALMVMIEPCTQLQCSGDPISDLIKTPTSINIFEEATQIINVFINMLQLGSSSKDVEKGLHSVIDFVYSQEELMFSTEGYDGILKAFQKLLNNHSHSENIVPAFKAVADHFSQLNFSNSIFKTVCQLIMQEFSYFQQKSQNIQATVEYMLSKLTFVQAQELFDVSLKSNLFLIKLISKNCKRSSFSDFWNIIVYQQIKCVVEMQCDDNMKNIIVQQLFETIETCGRDIDYTEYTKSNISSIMVQFTNLLNDYLREQINNPLSLHVLRFITSYLTHFQDQVKVNVVGIEQHSDKICNKISFKVFVQQYLVPQILPCLMTLATNDQHKQFEYITLSLSHLINQIIKQCVEILGQPLSFEKFFADRAWIQSIPEVYHQEVIPPQQTFNGNKLITNSCANIIKRITSFQNQSREVKQQTLELLISLLNTNQPILGENTVPVLRNICTQLLTSENYEDIRNKAYKLLGKFSAYDYDGAIQIFGTSGNQSMKNRALFISNLTFNSIENYEQFWQEIRSYYLAENADARQVSFDMVQEFTVKLMRSNLLEQFLNNLVGEIVSYNLQSNTKALHAMIIEATCILFTYGKLMSQTLTPEYIMELVKTKQPLPSILQGFHVLAEYLTKQLEHIVAQKLPLLKAALSYIEIYSANADSSALGEFYTSNYTTIYFVFSKLHQLSHVRIPLKRIFTAVGLCCGRDYLNEYLEQLEKDLVYEVQQNEELKQMQFVERQKCMSNLLAAQRNLISRVNKIARKVKPDSSFGRYEAAQYLIVHQTVPKELVSQLKGRESYEKDDLDLKKVLENNQNITSEEVDQLVMEAEQKYAQVEDEREEDLVLKNVKMQRDSQKEDVYQTILEQLNKIKQRRLYKIDTRFQKTGRESMNKKAGGDIGSAPSATLPIISSKQGKKLDAQNKSKYREGLGIIFGKESKKRRENVNLKKLGRDASKKVQGGRQKIAAIKKRGGDVKRKERK